MNGVSHADPVEGMGHERRDINVAAVAIFILILELTMLGCCVLGLAFHKGYRHWMKLAAVKISPMARFVTEPPQPRLQVDPTADMQVYRQSQETIATSYGWVNTEKGTVRLPLERAKALVVERAR